MASYLSGNTTVMSEEYFTKDVVIVTDEGDLVGVDACREYYSNY
jgi:hypothetical protein